MNAAGSESVRRHILVVEADPLISAMICDALEYAGFETTAVTAAEDALSLAVMDVPFDLVLADVDLAGPMSGWELAEAMREMRGEVPIVYASACAEAARPERRVSNSVHLPKPFTLVALCTAVRDLLAPARRAPDIAPAPRPVVIDLERHRALRAAS
ncbi:MAG TPA: response regulator [Xanthobacteraceae bacterium]|nr:response regulator [Xanthobacteraceae bacterium]